MAWVLGVLEGEGQSNMYAERVMVMAQGSPRGADQAKMLGFSWRGP